MSISSEAIKRMLEQRFECARTAAWQADEKVSQCEKAQQWAVDGENIARGIRDRNVTREDLHTKYENARELRGQADDNLRDAKTMQARRHQEYTDALRAVQNAN